MSNSPKKPNRKPAGKGRADKDRLTTHLMGKGRKRRATMAALSEAQRDGLPRNDLRPALAIIDVAIGDLKAAARHPRKGTATQIARVKRSIEAYGVVVPLLINDKNDVIAGHVVLAAAQALRLETLPCCIVSHLKPNQQKMLAIALNRAGETGEWDFEVLKDVLEDLVEDGEDILDTLFDGAELADILQDDPDEFDPETDEVDMPMSVTSRLGDVWELGRHVVGCGDARDSAYVARLMGSDVAEAAFLDAPYNVPIKGHVTGAEHHREFVMATGEMSRNGFFAFLGKSHQALLPHLQAGSVVFTCMDWRSVHILMTAAEKVGFELLNLVVWNKTNAGMGSLYRSQHELIVVLKKPGAKPINNIQLGKNGRYRSNVWTYPGGSSIGSETRDGLAAHSTPKNPAMVQDAILDVTTRTGIVMDTFLGGGTTLIATDRAGRRFRGGDLDPGYVDVALLRWMRETGDMPILRATGETFEAVRVRRMADEPEPDPASPPLRLGYRGTDAGHNDVEDLSDDDDLTPYH